MNDLPRSYLNGGDQHDPSPGFVTLTRLIADLGSTDRPPSYVDERPPKRLFRVVRFETYKCDCCSGGDNVVKSKHRTLPEAVWAAARCRGSWVESWDPTPRWWASRWRRLPQLDPRLPGLVRAERKSDA